MYRRKLTIASVLAVALLVAVSGAQPAAAYYCSNVVDYCAHNEIAHHAITILTNDGYTEVANKMQTYESYIALGLYQADVDGSADHGHHPTAHWLCGALGLCGADEGQRYFNQALVHYRAGQYTAAYQDFGSALHLIQDLTVADHAALNPNHQDYEEYVEWLIDETGVLSDVVSGGIYSFSALSGHYNDYTAWGWVDYSAHASIGYYYKSYYETATAMVPFAAKASAGFMKFFFDQAVRGTVVNTWTGTSTLGTGVKASGSVSLQGGYQTVYTFVLAGEYNPNYNLYLKWDSAPTTTDYSFCSTTSDCIEYIQVSGTASHPSCTGTLYYIVYAASSSVSDWRLELIRGKPRTIGEIQDSIGGPGITDTNTFSAGIINGYAKAFAYLARPYTGGVNFDLYMQWYSGSVTQPITTYYDAKSTSLEVETCSASRTTSASGVALGVYSVAGAGSYRLLLLVF